VAMVWGVSFVFLRVRLERIPNGLQWAVACLFILVVGMSMAELASAAPTSGGVSNGGLAGQNAKIKHCYVESNHKQLYFWTHSYSSPKWRNLLAWIVGCMSLLYNKLQMISFMSCRC